MNTVLNQPRRATCFVASCTRHAHWDRPAMRPATYAAATRGRIAA